MAGIFAQHHCDTREAGQLYSAWRKGSPRVRKRILDDPELFFKTQRQAQEKAPAGTGAELLRDLEISPSTIRNQIQLGANGRDAELLLSASSLTQQAFGVTYEQGRSGAQCTTRLPNNSSLFAVRLSFFSADGSVELADAIGTQFHDAVRHAVLLVLARSQRALHQHV